MAVLRQVRRASHRRRGDLRLRPARHDVRLRRRSAIKPTLDLGRQGAVLGLSADRRRDDPGGRCTRRCSTRAARSAPSATASPIRAIRSSAAVALKTLEIYERDKIVETAAQRAPQFQKRLMALGRSSAGRRGARHRPDRRARARRRQARPSSRSIRSAASARRSSRFARGGRPDRALHRAATCISICPPLIIKPARDRRAVRPARPARSTRRSTGRSASSCWRRESLRLPKRETPGFRPALSFPPRLKQIS